MFKKAEKKQSKLRLGIAGPSGSGKTWSALEIATGMGGKIAVIDTESGRASLYADDFDFQCHDLGAPFSPEKFIKAIKTAEANGFDILIIDSLSHAWAGDGGILSIADRAGGSFQKGWKEASPKHQLLVDTIITSSMHIICTMRTKTEYVVEQNEKGKQAPKKVGLSPVQRVDLEYEFTIYMEMSHDNIANISKDNTRVLGQTYLKPTREMGEALMQWLNTGKQVQTYQEKFNYYMNLIENSASRIQLQSSYNEAYKLFKDDPIFIEYIINAKDKRKADLEATITPEEITNQHAKPAKLIDQNRVNEFLSELDEAEKLAKK